jgi:hypothetical protein
MRIVITKIEGEEPDKANVRVIKDGIVSSYNVYLDRPLEIVVSPKVEEDWSFVGANIDYEKHKPTQWREK